MTFEAPGPFAVGFGFSKNTDEIHGGIAVWATALFHFLKNLLEAHDGGGLEITAMAEARTEERVGERLLVRFHFLQRQAFSFPGDEMPVEAFVIAEFEGGFGALIVRERGQESIRGIGHFLTDAVRAGRNGNATQEQSPYTSHEWFHKRVAHPKTGWADNSFRREPGMPGYPQGPGEAEKKSDAER